MIDTKPHLMSNSKKSSLGAGAGVAAPVDGKNKLSKDDRNNNTNNHGGTKAKAKNNKKTRAARNLRARERRARYVEEFISDSEEEEMEFRKFDVEEKLKCERFSAENYPCVLELNGSEITLEYFQRNGFELPILIKENTNNVLGMKIPPKSFTVDDVKQLVGSRRVLDVMNVETQMADTMTMKEWCIYYNNPERDRLLNVISLEFSHTKLETQVDSPRIVKQMDWVDLVWPRHLKKAQKEGTNALHEMKYPKVQKYCLMSVKGCYTDFHIDFGGTSVWYHILRGGKVFWLIPPTERNIQLYEDWTLSGKQSDIFFGDTVEHCARVHLEAGNTFLIPTGWIHAVYTLDDSLVFGGNFLHSFGIEKQLRVSQVEDLTKVPNKFRYPFYTELLWYVLVRYVHCLMGRNYLSVDDDGKCLLETSKVLTNGVVKEEEEDNKEEIKKEIKDEPSESSSTTILNNHSSTSSQFLTNNHSTTNNHSSATTTTNNHQDQNKNTENIKKDPYDTETEDEDEEEIERQLQLHQSQNGGEVFKPRPKMPSNPFISFTPGNAKFHLSKFEISGLKRIVHWLSQLSPSKRLVPDLVISSENLMKDVHKLIEDHENDDHALSVTNKPVLFWLTKKLHNTLLMNGHGSSNHHNHHHKPSPKPTGVTALGGALKRPKSPLGSSSETPQYRVSSGTTLKNDLIMSSFGGLIAQTGLKTGGFGAFNRMPNPLLASTPTTVASSSYGIAPPASSSLTTTSTITKPKPTKLTISTSSLPKVPNEPLSPLVKPSSPAYPPPPLPAGHPPPAYSTTTSYAPITTNPHQHPQPQQYQYPQAQVNYYPNPSQQHLQQSQPPRVPGEHTYNQSPTLYHNPNTHHNYAYHPYRPIRPYPGLQAGQQQPQQLNRSIPTPPTTATQQLPIRPVPTVVSPVVQPQPNQQQAQSVQIAISNPTYIQKPSPSVATISGVIVRPVAAIAPAAATYLQPTAQQVTYQAYQQQQQPAQQPIYNYAQPQIQQVGQPQVQPQVAQVNGQHYYQYYQQQQSQQVQPVVQAQIQVVQQQQQQSQPQSQQQSQQQQPMSHYSSTLPSTTQQQTSQQQAQLIYYHNQPQTAQPITQPSIVVRPQFIQTYHHQPTQQSVLYNPTTQQYNTTTQQYNIQQPSTTHPQVSSQSSTSSSSLQLTTQLYQQQQPKPIYYVANATQPTAATITQPIAANYPNQTYLMTQQSYNPAATQQLIMTGHNYPMSSYQQPQPQQPYQQQSQQQLQQQSQQQQQQQQVTTVTANISSFYPQYSSLPGGSSGAYSTVPTPTHPTYNIQYGR